MHLNYYSVFSFKLQRIMSYSRSTNVAIKTLYFISILTLLRSCSNDYENNNISNPITSIEISTGQIYPAFKPEIKDYYCTSLNTLNTIEITIGNFDSFKKIYINNTKVVKKTTSLKLNPGEDITIKYISSNGNQVKYTIHYLPIDMPKINVITKNNPSNGYILINMLDFSLSSQSDFSYIAILDNNGFPVYYNKTPYKGTINFNYFKTEDGSKRFSYNVNDIGKVIVMNEKFEEINRLNLLPFNSHGSYPTDNHDFIYLNDNHFILPAYVVREDVDMSSYGGGNAVDLVDFVFQEIKNNQVIFEWDSRNHPELLEATDDIYYNQYATSSKVDYFHFNSISIDPLDNNFIISARHTNQIYKIDRTNGSIIWRFGGKDDDYNLTDNELISHPHHATRLSNGNLLLFDNGVTKNPKQTRIVEFDIDEINKTASIAKEYTETGRYSDIMGSVQKIQNGNYFIGWGGNITSQINANKSDITEIDSNGNILLDISFSNNPNRFTYSYRALKYNFDFE